MLLDAASFWALALGKAETALFAAAVFTVDVKGLLADEVVETAADSVALLVLVVKFWFGFFLFVGHLSIDLGFVLGP